MECSAVYTPRLSNVLERRLCTRDPSVRPETKEMEKREVETHKSLLYSDPSPLLSLDTYVKKQKTRVSRNCPSNRRTPVRRLGRELPRKIRTEICLTFLSVNIYSRPKTPGEAGSRGCGSTLQDPEGRTGGGGWGGRSWWESRRPFPPLALRGTRPFGSPSLWVLT